MIHGSWATHFFSIFNRSGLIFYLSSFDSSLCEAWEVLVKAYGKTFCSWLCALFLFFVLSLPSFVFLWYFLILALEKTMNKRSLFMFTIHLWFHRPFLQPCCHLFSDWKSLTYLITSDAETIWYLCHPNTLPLSPFQTCVHYRNGWSRTAHSIQGVVAAHPCSMGWCSLSPFSFPFLIIPHIQFTLFLLLLSIELTLS